jgi:hypothetical protein
MKNTGIKIALFAVMAILLYGCPEDPYYVYTRISPDGSCYRELIRNADSLFVASMDTAHNPFPIKLDSTWNVTFHKRFNQDTLQLKDTAVNKQYRKDSVGFVWVATAVKHYESVKDLSEDFSYDNSNWASINPEIAFEKKFCWFYTYYEFKETYRSFNPFTRVPISEYLTPMEVAALYGENKELYKGKNGFEIKNMLQGMEDKADIWLEHNFYEELFQLYLQHYSQFRNPPVDSVTFALQKDSIFYRYVIKDTFDIENIGEILNRHFNTTVFLTDSIGDSDKVFEEKFPQFHQYSDIEIDYKMTMPGKIIETNAPFLNTDTLTWRIEDDRFFHNDYQLHAISRKANYWTFLLTAAAIAIAAAGFLVKRKPL